MKFFNKLNDGMKKTKSGFFDKIKYLFTKTELNEDFYEELEYVLISSDVGAKTSSEIIEDLKELCKKKLIKTCEEAKSLLKQILVDRLTFEKEEEKYPLAYLIIGVNGVGKTTTIGKLCHNFLENNKSVLLCAGDTFRAAASEQLTEWANRNKVRIVKHNEGADPASVVFDAVESQKAKKEDVLLIDTAGRLHNKANLMEELTKISKIVSTKNPECNYKKILVLDATTGQNAVSQVEYFNEAVGIDGIILTKLDSTSKGGIIIPIINELEVPVLYVGVGEQIDDLIEFDANDYVDSLFEEK